MEEALELGCGGAVGTEVGSDSADEQVQVLQAVGEPVKGAALPLGEAVDVVVPLAEGVVEVVGDLGGVVTHQTGQLRGYGGVVPELGQRFVVVGMLVLLLEGSSVSETVGADFVQCGLVGLPGAAALFADGVLARVVLGHRSVSRSATQRSRAPRVWDELTAAGTVDDAGTFGPSCSAGNGPGESGRGRPGKRGPAGR